MKPQFEYPKDEPLVLITHVVNAPRELVWKALSDPKMMAQWWGPRRYTNDVKEFDFRVGGKWRIAQSDGRASFEFFGEYKEIKAPEKIVQTFGFMEYPPALETMLLTDIGGGRTRLNASSRFTSMEGRDGMVASGMEEGATESYERLDELVQRELANA